MQTKPLCLGMIGCGKHATANIYSTLHMLGRQIHAVSARHLDRALMAAERFNIEHAYDNYRTMLEHEKLDAVFVVTDQYSQAAITCDCLRAGCDVFVEKPLGMNEAEARQVAELAQSLGRKVMVGFMKRFSPSYEMARQVMARPGFGRPLSFTGMFAITSGRPGWNNDVYTKVGGVHYVDLMRHLFGEVTELHGFSNSAGAEVDNLFTMRFDSGVIGSMFFGGLPAWKRHWEELCITGRDGFVKVDNMMSVRYHLDDPSLKGDRWQQLDEEDRVFSPMSTSGSGGWRDLYLNGYVGEIRHFLDCLEQDKEPLCNAWDNVRTMALCDRIVACLK